MNTSDLAWQYRRRQESKLHGPYSDEKLISCLSQPHFARQAKDWQFRNILDADIAWIDLSEVCKRLRIASPDPHATDSDSSSQEDASGQTLRSATPRSSEDQAGSCKSSVHAPESEKAALTAPTTPDHKDNRILDDDAFQVTLGRCVGSIPGEQPKCFCLLSEPDTDDISWGPLKLEDALLCCYQGVINLDTPFALVENQVPEYFLKPSTELLRGMVMPFRDHITACKQNIHVVWSLSKIEQKFGLAAIERAQRDSLAVPESGLGALGVAHRNMSEPFGTDPIANWSGMGHNGHPDPLRNGLLQRSSSSSQAMQPNSLLQSASRQHNHLLRGMSAGAASADISDFFNRAASDSDFLNRSASDIKALGRSRNGATGNKSSRVPRIWGMHGWVGRQFVVSEANRQRIKAQLIECIRNSDVPPPEQNLPPALANPPPQQQKPMNHNNHNPNLPHHLPSQPHPRSFPPRMSHTPVPTSSMLTSASFSMPGGLGHDLHNFSQGPGSGPGPAHPGQLSMQPPLGMHLQPEFNIHAADFQPDNGPGPFGSMLDPPNMPSMQQMDSLAASFSGQLNTSSAPSSGLGLSSFDTAPLSAPGSVGNLGGLQSVSEAEPYPTQPSATQEQLRNVLIQMMGKMNNPGNGGPVPHQQQVQELLSTIQSQPHWGHSGGPGGPGLLPNMGDVPVNGGFGGHGLNGPGHRSSGQFGGFGSGGLGGQGGGFGSSSLGGGLGSMPLGTAALGGMQRGLGQL